ncbi:MAG TPA: hypothetical protein VGD26_14175 [Chitinophagaceae bacterium]
MALSSTTIQQPIEKTESNTTIDNTGAASVLAAIALTVYAAQKSRKQLRRLKRKALLTLFRYKLQATLSRMFKPFSKAEPQISNRTLLYILLGIAVLILLFISWPAAVVLLLLGILLVLLLK